MENTTTKTAPALYTSTQIESDEKRAQLSRDVLSILAKAYDFRVLGAFVDGGAVYIRTGFEGGYAMWSIADNGGEFNVEKVNSGEIVSIPYFAFRLAVDAGTVAYRIACVVKDEPIDWSAEWSDLVEDFGAAAVRS